MEADEAALMWRALERLPETYRLPLILYYREHRSVPQAARWLDLSEETLRQRLSRGRALLKDNVAEMIGQSLGRSGPDPRFTAGVLAALPSLGAPARLAAGAAAAKGPAAAVLSAVPVVGNLVVTVMNLAYGRRLLRDLEPRVSSEVRERLRRGRWQRLWLALSWVAGMAALVAVARSVGCERGIFSALLTGWTVVGLAVALLRFRRTAAPARREVAGGETAWEPLRPLIAREYRSPARFLGIPLVHVASFRAFGTERERTRPVCAWVAIASLHGRGPNVACGLLYAQGRIAIAPVSVGLLGIGILPVAAVAAGGWAVGLASFGHEAAGLLALGVTGAKGVWAIGAAFASGTTPFGPEVDTQAAAAFFQSAIFFRTIDWLVRVRGVDWALMIAGLWALRLQILGRRAIAVLQKPAGGAEACRRP